MSIRTKTSDKARSIPYLDGAAIEKLVLTEEKDSIGPHHARPAPMFEFESCTGRIFYASGFAGGRAKNVALPKTRCGCCAACRPFAVTSATAIRRQTSSARQTDTPPICKNARSVTPRSWPARRLSIFEGSESELARSAAAEVLSHELKLEAPLQIDPTCRRPRHCIAGSSARIHSAPACSFPERQPLEICRRLVDSSRRSGREIFDQRRASADVARSQSGRIHVTYVVFRMEEGGDASLLFQPQK